MTRCLNARQIALGEGGAGNRREIMEYRHTPDMGEISGFGGGYEKACQDMLEAGVKWLHEHPDAAIRLVQYKGIFGVVKEDSEDTKALSKAVTAVCDDCSGAMHHGVMSRLAYNRKAWVG